MRPATLCRLAVAGNRTDHLRTALTAASSATAVVALLAAATVLAIERAPDVILPGGGIEAGPNAHYSTTLLAEAGLRVGVVIALVLLTLPVLALAGQAVRLGAPARDRRLAAIRLAGATPGEAMLIAGAETVVAALLGSVAGLGVFLLLRVVLERRDANGDLLLPTDVLPSPLWIVVLTLLIPVVAGVVGAVLLRRVAIGPLGVVRRTRSRGPRPWPGILIIAGLLMFELPRVVTGLVAGTRSWAVALGSGAVLTVVGVVLGTGWISYTTGRLLQRSGRRPAMLLAGRRLMADPWSGSRTLGALLATVIVGAVALRYRSYLLTEFEAYDRYYAVHPAERAGSGADEGFYTGAIDLIMVAVGIGVVIAAAGMLISLAEGIVARRRSYAALTAVGVPGRTLTESVLWQTMLPLVPALLLALTSGSVLMRSTREIRAGDIRLQVPVPLESLALLGGGAFLIMLIMTGVGLLVLRSSTDLEELRVG
ncbi:FtsX-like permease family protein [Actinoplanes sp. NPDC051494]|uniref:FtsX-like permease family protein n=1 Tax=Actinoplanes sp. NPDC051494 TaxID=3363907 RepID=UPI00379002F5